MVKLFTTTRKINIVLAFIVLAAGFALCWKNRGDFFLGMVFWLEFSNLLNQNEPTVIQSLIMKLKKKKEKLNVKR